MELFSTVVMPKAKELVNQVLDSTFLSEGKVAKQFEQALSEQLGLCNPVCVNSGTSALHLALLAVGVKAGDEVILPAQTFIATALAVLYCGAKPVFADIDPKTGNLDLQSVYNKQTEKTKAIIAVHWGGYPADLIDLDLFSFLYGIPIIEDAAHALGAVYKGEPVGNGNWSSVTCFSFQAIKALTTSDGGAICSGYTNIVNYVRRNRWFGIDRENDLPNELGERQYTLNEIGYKYHMPDYCAALGLGNLDGFRVRLLWRINTAHTYDAHFRNVPGVTLPDYKTDRKSAYWLYPILVENRHEFVRMMKARGIPVSVVHQRIDKHPVCGGLQDLPGQAYFDEHQINLPIHWELTHEDIDAVINAVKGGW